MRMQAAARRSWDDLMQYKKFFPEIYEDKVLSMHFPLTVIFVKQSSFGDTHTHTHTHCMAGVLEVRDINT